MPRIVLTYDDYAALPDDGKRYELHAGELVVTPAPGARHQDVLLNLAVILAPHVRTIGRGKLMVAPFDCIIEHITVVQPDILYLDEQRVRLISERALEGAPTLAIEILSPFSGHIDRRRKMALYAAHDVTWYWIVDPPARTIEVYHLVDRGYEPDARLEGDDARPLPPFSDLVLHPSDVWR
jgi:Uma2 family endonuclease